MSTRFGSFLSQLRSPFFLTSLMLAIFGASNVFAFAPVGWWWLALFSHAILYYSLIETSWSVKQKIWFAFLFQSSCIFACICWLTIAMSRFGGIPWVLSILAIVLLSSFLATFLSILVSLVFWLEKKSILSAPMLWLALPLAVFFSECGLVYLFTGFPWVLIGYIHTDTWLSAWAPIIGVLGIGFIHQLSASCLALIGAAVFQYWKKHQKISSWVMLAGAVVLGLNLSTLFLQRITWTQEQGRSIHVRLLQGNVPQDLKFQREHIIHSLIWYRDMLISERADLSVTPETALPILTSMLPPGYWQDLSQYAEKLNTQFLVGIAADDGDSRFSNSLIEAHGKTRESYRYDKNHLVPFGEYIPGIPFARDLVHAMKIPMSDYSYPNKFQQPIGVADQWLMPNICYEDVFGYEISAQLAYLANAGLPVAGILINTSNMAYYGDSFAIPQHLQIARMRALETQRPVLRATNTGSTAWISHDGIVQQQLPYWKEGVLNVHTKGRNGLTPYIIWQDKFMILLNSLLLIALVGGSLWQLKRKR